MNKEERKVVETQQKNGKMEKKDMREDNKGIEIPKTEVDVEKLQDELYTDIAEEIIECKLYTGTAEEAMECELEELDEIGLGYSILDNQDLRIKDILEFHKNCEKLCDLAHILPHTTLCWINQRTDIYNRLSQTEFFDWQNSKKELSYDDYRKLESELNKDKDGISLSQLTTITDKNENSLFQDLRAGCGLSVVNISDYEFVMENYLYVRLIPLVNENNQLEEKIRTQYILRGNALSLLAEYWANLDNADMYC